MLKSFTAAPRLRQARPTVGPGPGGRRWSTLLMLGLLVILSWPAPAVAETAIVHFSPASSEVRVGETITIALQIASVSDLFGVNLRIQFNAQFLEVVDSDPTQRGVQFQSGDFPYPDFVGRNEVNSGVGTIWYAATQINPREPVSGSGTAHACFRPLDITPPVISGLTPGSGSTVSGGAVSIGAAFSDDTAIDTSSVALKIDGAQVTSGLQVTPTGVAYSTTLQPGTYSIELTVSDMQGNPRTATWAFTVASAFPAEYIAIGVVAVAAIAGVAFFVLRKKRPSAFRPD